MSAPVTGILETALALQRDPGERFRLRERALPEGLTHVLEVASGAPTSVREAAEALGESEQTVLTAARFYLEQVLFASPDADAYRILGVAPSASVEQIRAHHRWLQRWLHPDRSHAGDASVFATRVNQAWAQLRSPELRHEYDVHLAEARMSDRVQPLPAARIRRWQFEDAMPAQGGHRARWLLAAALASCAVLAVLVVRHGESVEPWELPEAETIAGDVTGHLAPPPAHDALEAALATPVLPPAGQHAPARPELRTGVVAVPPPMMEPAAAASSPVIKPIERTVSAPAKRPASTPTVTRIASVAPAEVAPAALHVPPALAPAPKAESGGAPAAMTATTATTADTAMLLERMRKAEQRVAQLTAYLAAEPSAAPLWNDVQTKLAADRVRDTLSAAGGRLDLGSPDWRLQPDDATVSVDYRCGSCRVSKGRLNVKLVWRQGLWLVRGVDLAPSA